MSENTYDAIYKIGKQAETKSILIWTLGSKIEGELLDCSDSNCQKGTITLKDVTVECKHTSSIHHYKWFNIPSCHIAAFTFKCCVID